MKIVNLIVFFCFLSFFLFYFEIHLNGEMKIEGDNEPQPSIPHEDGQVPFVFIGTIESIGNAKVLLEYHLVHLKVNSAFRVFSFECKFFNVSALCVRRKSNNFAKKNWKSINNFGQYKVQQWVRCKIFRFNDVRSAATVATWNRYGPIEAVLVAVAEVAAVAAQIHRPDIIPVIIYSIKIVTVVATT